MIFRVVCCLEIKVSLKMIQVYSTYFAKDCFLVCTSFCEPTGFWLGLLDTLLLEI